MFGSFDLDVFLFVHTHEILSDVLFTFVTLSLCTLENWLFLTHVQILLSKKYFVEMLSCSFSFTRLNPDRVFCHPYRTELTGCYVSILLMTSPEWRVNNDKASKSFFKVLSKAYFNAKSSFCLQANVAKSIKV